MAQGFDPRKIEKLIKDETAKAAKDAQATLNSVSATHGGKPVAQVTPALRSRFRAKGWKFTEAELKSHAEAISQGQNIKVRVK